MEITVKVNYKNEKLQKLRQAAGPSQSQLAEAAGVNVRMYQKYEQGERMPSLDTLVRIADILGTSTDYLLERDYYLRAIGIDPTKME